MSSKCNPVVGSSSRYSVRPVDALGQLGRQLDALGLAAGQGRAGLPQTDVAEIRRP